MREIGAVGRADRGFEGCPALARARSGQVVVAGHLVAEGERPEVEAHGADPRVVRGVVGNCVAGPVPARVLQWPADFELGAVGSVTVTRVPKILITAIGVPWYWSGTAGEVALARHAVGKPGRVDVVDGVRGVAHAAVDCRTYSRRARRCGAVLAEDTADQLRALVAREDPPRIALVAALRGVRVAGVGTEADAEPPGLETQDAVAGGRRKDPIAATSGTAALAVCGR